MKLTWFGDTALRVHLGGQVVVLDAHAAGVGVDRGELTAGADRVIELSGRQALAEGLTWRPRVAQRLLEAGNTTRAVDVWSLGEGALLLDPDEDMPLLVLGGAVPKLGRWVERAVVVLVGADIAGRALTLVGRSAPRLMALAGSESDVDAAFEVLRDRLDGTGLVALEPGLAVEV
ncbi:hypothetical protein SAMN06295905_1090 [Devosia lucknowensis]|uniref:Uncharacterized protein n=1 Tax=Devosia lucknowensis TaxID=1096929 RepID=A0A1Y6EQR3_9HYPH|nr:hypothetical protein [Devosia lucknowensis]SMQ64907.1 hypothetical protein SAMN06295905_1090 [Devosia lucknowensis]